VSHGDFHVTLEAVSAPLVPSPLDFVGRRKFSFYPPIRNTDPNDWLLGTGSWSEVQVINAHTGLQLWIPRQYVGGISDGAGFRLVVELTKELDYGHTGVSPRVKRVIQMPEVADFGETTLRQRKRNTGRAPVVAIKLEPEPSGKDSFVAKVLLVAVILSVLAALLATIARLYLPQPDSRPAVSTGRI
jgi:hypothetical protein